MLAWSKLGFNCTTLEELQLKKLHIGVFLCVFCVNKLIYFLVFDCICDNGFH